ncbi:MAG: hypothetical protein AAB515_01290 [Patescibacteria group bacterium]
MPDSLLLKFQKLPDAAKAHASDPSAMRALDNLEKDFGVNLAEVVMRVMVQEIEPAKLDEALEQQYKVAPGKGKELAKHLLDDLFFKYRLLDMPDVRDVLTAEKPATPLQPQAGASQYLVHPDDHKDIAPHVAALQVTPTPRVDTDPTHVAVKLLQLEKLTLDDMLSKRFQKIVEARIVDVRDKRETTDMLQRPTKIGGMGFDEPRASRIVGELENVVEELHRRPRPVMPKAQPVIPVAPPPPVQPVVPVVPKPLVLAPAVVAKSSTPQVQKQVATPSPALRAPQGASDGSHPPAAPAGGEGGIKPPTPALAAKPTVAPPPWLRPAQQTPAPMVRPASTPVARPAASRPASPTARPAPNYRDMVTDVRAPAKVMGPIEVLGNLSIEDFRRLGTTATGATAKISEEMDALARDSFAQRAAGIAAFRQSPTFKAYLQLGQMAMERKEEVVEIIDLLKAQKTTTLTAEEFEAIGALMRTFRF